jgi:hypothetical protein
MELPRDPETQRRVRLLDAITQGSYAGGPYGAGGSRPLSLIAFTGTPLGIPVPTAGAHPLHTLTVVEQRLQLDVPPGPFQLPPELSPPEVKTNSGARAGFNPFGSGSSSAFTAVYEYRPPLPKRATVTALDIELSGSTTPSPPIRGGPAPSRPAPVAPGQPQGDAAIAVYNWQSGGWEAWPAGQRQIRVEPTTPYLGPEGQVRVQMTAGTGSGYPTGAPRLTLEGVMAG